ncbi:GFA family protein [Microbulbifer sp. OS29]|uniref:GFA family protein n=1 Tax=Microbulbifer okhotskensis TaxID=2926617 RepID=A0A9X2J876_9GAMM|nr:GFA family protein [Microbulbifer okhotskensis]MCO1336585.1 GFA family protein [Microbulbifer okhotskensis]
MNKTGSCLCGAVHFEIEGEFEGFFLCHCSYCRKDTGSAHAANLFSTSAKLEWLSGAEISKTFKLPGTRHSRSFCGQCGSALPLEDTELGHLAVPAGSLDSEVEIKPNAHIFMASKAEWDRDLETLPRIDTFPQMDSINSD